MRIRPFPLRWVKKETDTQTSQAIINGGTLNISSATEAEKRNDTKKKCKVKPEVDTFIFCIDLTFNVKCITFLSRQQSHTNLFEI